jgi:hypothetical protein
MDGGGVGWRPGTASGGRDSKKGGSPARGCVGGRSMLAAMGYAFSIVS